MPTYRLLIAQFPYGGCTHPDVSDFVAYTYAKCLRDSTLSAVELWRKDGTPLHTLRNACLLYAEVKKFDFVLMIDADMAPDLPLPGAKPFWETAWPFARDHQGPCVIGAPYCGGPPHEEVNVIQWVRQQSDNPNDDYQLWKFEREQAGMMNGITQVAAIGTGLTLFSMAGIVGHGHPRFHYVYGDATQCRVTGTEEVPFIRDLAMNGVPVYCAWDCWAGHWKKKLVSKPVLCEPHQVSKAFKEAIRRELLAEIKAEMEAKKNGEAIDNRPQGESPREVLGLNGDSRAKVLWGNWVE